MSNSRIDPTTTSVQVAQTTQRQTSKPPETPFSQVFASGANALVAGASVVTGVVGGPVLAAAVREAGSQLIGAATGGGGGGGGAGASAAGIMNASSQGSELSQMHQMQRESQSFNLQLLNLQTDVQNENRRFTTLSNVIKSSHDTAKAAVGNIRS
jgi:hypothetical protein